MNLQETIDKINNLDVNNLDINTIGEWPHAVHKVIYLVVFLATLLVGYHFRLISLGEQYDKLIDREESLKQEFIQKTTEAVELVSYRKKMEQTQKVFQSLLKQLPGDTEVPGLLEDISLAGRGAGLQFESITLKPEKVTEFYIELPISISVKGKYHELGNFVSGVANLPRIVTLHDFKIEEEIISGQLKMDILAKTYRYNEKKQ